MPIPRSIQEGTSNVDYMNNFPLLRVYLSSPSINPKITFFEENQSPIRDIFDELVNNRRFISKAKEARRRIRLNPSSFINFTTKFSNLID